MERSLSIFTEIRTGEGVSALLLSLNIFLILTSYYIMKPVREALILSGGFGELSGAVVKSLASAGQVTLLMVVMLPLYAWIASRVLRRRLINVVTIFFTACLGLFYILALAKVSLGVIFFLWVGIFNLMVPAQFWAFSNDLYTPEAGKRIFVLIAFGQSLGAVLGASITRLLIEPLGIYQLLLIAGGILLLSLILTNIVESREKGESRYKITEQKEIDKPLKKGGAFRFVFRNKYLLMIAFLMLFLNWVNTTGEYILGQTVENQAKSDIQNSTINYEAEQFALEKIKYEQSNIEEVSSASSIRELSNTNQEKAHEYVKEFKEDYVKEYIGKFYGGFYAIVNLIGLLLQLFIVSRILKYLGIRVALLFLPIIALTGYFFIIFYPLLSIIRWAKTAENSTDYSLQNTVRQVLFLPTTREEKYKAKQAIDTFFWRAGDLLSAGLVIVGTTLLAFQIKHFAIFNIALVCIWIILAVFIGLANKKLTAEHTKEA